MAHEPRATQAPLHLARRRNHAARTVSRVPAILAAVLFLAVQLTAWTGCSPGSRDPLLGKWENVDGGDMLEFLADGTVTNSDRDGPLFGGKYERLDGSRINVNFGGPSPLGAAREYVVRAGGGGLSITGPDGTTKTYRRIE